MRKYTTLISDFDNTLYDWFHMWNQSFGAMLREIKRVSGLADDVLIPEIRKVHQQFGTSEYAFLVEKLPSLRAAFPEENLRIKFDSAIHAYRSERKANLSLYPGVLDTLQKLRSLGITIVLYTDSRAFYTIDRIKRLELDELLDFVFSPPDHEIPDAITNHAKREKYQLHHAKYHHLPEGVIKPNPEVLVDILRDIGRDASECIYVGDSIMKDIAMAQDAGVMDVHAKYGVVQHHADYPLLRKVSHWTDEDVKREQEISKRTIRASHTISDFSEIIKYFET